MGVTELVFEISKATAQQLQKYVNQNPRRAYVHITIRIFAYNHTHISV